MSTLYRANERVRTVPLWRRVITYVNWTLLVLAIVGWIFIFSYVGLI